MLRHEVEATERVKYFRRREFSDRKDICLERETSIQGWTRQGKFSVPF